MRMSPRAGVVPRLPAHLERAQVRLTSLIAGQRWPEGLHRAMDEAIRALDRMRAEARGARGESRVRILSELRSLDAHLMGRAWGEQPEPDLVALREEAARDLAPFRERMPADAWQSAVDAAAKRFLRERLGLPSLALE